LSCTSLPPQCVFLSILQFRQRNCSHSHLLIRTHIRTMSAQAGSPISEEDMLEDLIRDSDIASLGQRVCPGCEDALGQTPHLREEGCRYYVAPGRCRRCEGHVKFSHSRVGLCRLAQSASPRDHVDIPEAGESHSDMELPRCPGCDDPSHHTKHTKGPGCVFQPRAGPCKKCAGRDKFAHTRVGDCRFAPRDVSPQLSQADMVESIGEDDPLEDVPPPSLAKARGRCGMFTWPCPRSWGATLNDRKFLNVLKPDDMSRQSVSQLMVEFVPDVCKAVTAREPHKRRNPVTGEPEYHVHVVFESSTTFAFKNIEEKFRAHGVRGYFTFAGETFASLLSYVAQERAHKVHSDLDPSPFCHGFSSEEIPSILETMPRKPQKKRTKLSFVEFTEVCVDNDLRDSVSTMRHAKKLRLEGDTLFYSHVGTLGAKLDAELDRVWQMWNSDTSSSLPRFFHEHPPYPLSDYVIPEEVASWKAGQMGQRSLVLAGAANCGKTAFAKAILGKPFWFLPTLEATNSVRILPDHAVVFDELCLHSETVDSAKAIMDVENDRHVRARFQNGFLPSGVPRVFTTNVSSLQMFLPHPRNDADWDAMTRRVVFVHVQNTLRRA
jgi:hypothetical protein